MKTKPIKKVLGAIGLTSAIVALSIVSCTKEKIVEVEVEKIVTVTDSILVYPDFTLSQNTGTDKINASIGGYPPSSYATTDSGGWKMDKSHSNVGWETKYYANGAMLTGRFNMFDLKANFDEANPANTTIKGWVQLSTFNTGEPGRDAFSDGSDSKWNAAAGISTVRWDTTINGITTNTAVPTTQFYKQGCGMGYMGLKFDTAKSSTGKVIIPLPAYTPKASTDTAYFTSTSCVKENNYYKVTGNFTFRGVTKTVEMKMGFLKRGTSTATSGKPYKTDRAALFGEFTILANTDFGVNSSSINDEVKIKVNCNLVTNKYLGTNPY